MCYAKPGPRCTSHARAQLVKAKVLYNVTQNSKNIKALQEAQLTYDSTPGGYEELLGQLSNTNDISIINEIESRMTVGRTLRDMQIAYAKENLSHGFPNPRHVRRGLNAIGDEESGAVIEDLNKAAGEWRKTLTREEDNAVARYNGISYEDINLLLIHKEEQVGIEGHDDEYHREYVLNLDKTISLMDQALAKVPALGEPRTLYRSFRVPGAQGSIDPLIVRDKWLKKFEPGATVTFATYLSTSVDSDLMVYNTTKRAHKPGEHIVFEILSTRGASVANSRDGHHNIQSYEREVLLPRESKMQVVSVLPNVSFESTYDRNSRTFDFWRMASGPKRTKVTVVQMIDVSE